MEPAGHVRANNDPGERVHGWGRAKEVPRGLSVDGGRCGTAAAKQGRKYKLFSHNIMANKDYCRLKLKYLDASKIMKKIYIKNFFITPLVDMNNPY